MADKTEQIQEVMSAFKALMKGNELTEAEEKIILESFSELNLRTLLTSYEQEN